MTASSAFDLIRPFLWIAAFAFVAGFSGYALLGGAGARASSDLHRLPQPAAVEASFSRV